MLIFSLCILMGCRHWISVARSNKLLVTKFGLGIGQWSVLLMCWIRHVTWKPRTWICVLGPWGLLHFFPITHPSHQLSITPRHCILTQYRSWYFHGTRTLTRLLSYYNDLHYHEYRSAYGRQWHNPEDTINRLSWPPVYLKNDSLQGDQYIRGNTIL